MASRKNKDIQILVKLASQGNFDEAQAHLEKLKQSQGETGAAGVGAFAKLKTAMTAWATSAQVSAASVRRAFMTVLGPIGALLTIIEVAGRVFGKLITFVSDYKKAQAEANKTIHDAAAAFENANGHKQRYADVTGVELLQKAVKTHEADLKNIAKNYEALTAKVTEAKNHWYTVSFISSATTRTYQEQLALLSRMQGELEREIAAKNRQIEAEKALEEATKKRVAAEEQIADRIAQLTLDETDNKLRNIEKQLDAYRKAGADQALIDQLSVAERNRLEEDAEIAADAARQKKEAAEQAVADRIAQLTLDETELKQREIEKQLEAYAAAGVAREEIERLAAAETAQLERDTTTRKINEQKKREADEAKARDKKEKEEGDQADALKGIATDLATFQRSKSKDMATIGKTAASAEALIDTYLAAQKSFAALAGIPVVGPALGTAAAAAAIAAGMARVQAINAVALEEGGVTERETLARIGEKGRKEGVLPLENPRAMRMVGEAIAAAGGGGEGGATHITIENHFNGYGGNDEEVARRVAMLVLQQVRDRTPVGRSLARAVITRAGQDGRRAF